MGNGLSQEVDLNIRVVNKLNSVRDYMGLDPFVPRTFLLSVIAQADYARWEDLSELVAVDDEVGEFYYRVPDRRAALEYAKLSSENDIPLMKALVNALFDKEENADLAGRLCVKIRTSTPPGKWLAFFFPAERF